MSGPPDPGSPPFPRDLPEGFRSLSPIPPLIALIGRRILSHMDRLARPAGLNSTMALSLVLLHEHQGATQEELARRIGIDKSQVTRSVKALLDDGLLTRIRHPEDGRAYQLFLTPQVTVTLGRLLPDIQATHDRLVGNLDPGEREQLNRLLMKVLANSAGLGDMEAQGSAGDLGDTERP